MNAGRPEARHHRHAGRPEKIGQADRINLRELLGTETEHQAQNISKRCQAVAAVPEDEAEAKERQGTRTNLGNIPEKLPGSMGDARDEAEAKERQRQGVEKLPHPNDAGRARDKAGEAFRQINLDSCGASGRLGRAKASLTHHQNAKTIIKNENLGPCWCGGIRKAPQAVLMAA